MLDATTISRIKTGDVTLIGVHDGAQHKDENIAVALYRFTHPGEDVVVYRSRDEKRLAKCKYQFDVGLGKFDHHQKEKGAVPFYDNGVKYAACGLVAREFIKDEGFLNYLLENGLYGIQAKDNGQKPEDLPGVDFSRDPFSFIDLFNNTWLDGGASDSKKQNNLFIESSEMTLKVIKRMHKTYTAIEEGKKVIKDSISAAKNGLVIFPCYIQGMVEAVTEANNDREDKILVAVFKTQNAEEWNVQVTRKKQDSFDSWVSNDKEYCEQLPGFIFVHTTGFIAKFSNEESAMLAAKKAVENYTD